MASGSSLQSYIRHRESALRRAPWGGGSVRTRVRVHTVVYDAASRKKKHHALMNDFYDQLAPLYHLITKDWNATVHRQGDQLSALIEYHVAGASEGIGRVLRYRDSAIALAMRGYSVTASDLSAKEIDRARQEAIKWGSECCSLGLRRTPSACSSWDRIRCRHLVRQLLPHLLTDDDLVLALKEMLACLCVGGGCIITVRDYEHEERGKNLVSPSPAATQIPPVMATSKSPS